MEFKMKENGFVSHFEYGEIHISGDEKYGFRPYQLLVSAISVCSGGVLRKILAKQRIPYSDITIKADVTRNPEGAQEIKSIHIHFTIYGSNLKKEKIERAIDLTQKHCSMVQSVKDSIIISESFELKT